MEIKSEISNLASNFLNKNFSIKTDYIEIQNTKNRSTEDRTAGGAAAGGPGAPPGKFGVFHILRYARQYISNL